MSYNVVRRCMDVEMTSCVYREETAKTKKSGIWKRSNMDKVQHEESATLNECNTKKVQPEKSATREKCTLEIAKDENSTT